MCVEKIERIYLVSSSPRRKAILEMFNIPITVHIPNIKESKKHDINGAIPMALTNAQAKMDFFLKSHTLRKISKAIAISADTVVARGERVFGKARDVADCIETLKELMGGWHEVATAYVIYNFQDGGKVRGHALTKVKLAHIPEEVLERYITMLKARGGMGWAGCYGIQDVSSAFVERIEGDYYNVVGLPIHSVQEALVREFSLSLI